MSSILENILELIN